MNYEELKKVINQDRSHPYDRTEIIGLRAWVNKLVQGELLIDVPKHMTDTVDIAQK